jgi:dCTP diphosphatase
MSESSPKDDLQALTRDIRTFAEARDWGAYHTPKNLAMALAVEAAELMEPFLWLTPEEAGGLHVDRAALEAVEEEVADVAIYLLRLADVLGIDVAAAVRRKLAANEVRFPVDKVRGRARIPKAEDQ